MSFPCLDLAARPIPAYDTQRRLAEVKKGETVVAKYEYDGLNGRVERGIGTPMRDSSNGVDVYQHLFYGEGWQVVETRWGHGKGLRRWWA